MALLYNLQDHGPENADEFMRVKNLPLDTHPDKLLYVYDKTSVMRKYECPRVFLDDGTKDPRYQLSLVVPY